jgi:dihydroorotase-like cyclic amidohydrolase
MKYLLKGGFVVDPFSKVVKKLDLLWEGAKITEIGEQLDVPGAKELLLEECFIFPGFVYSVPRSLTPGKFTEKLNLS